MRQSLNKGYILSFIISVILLVGCMPAQSIFFKQDEGVIKGDQILIGDVYQLFPGSIIDGNIIGIGTTLIIAEDSLVKGDINAFGSTLEISGSVEGDINVFAGTTKIFNEAHIYGNINQIYQQVVAEEEAQIDGQINTLTIPIPVSLPIGEVVNTAAEWTKPTRWIIFQLSRTLAFCLITVLAVVIFKRSTNLVAKSIEENIAITWGLGLLTIIAAPISSLVLIITICLSPIGLLLLLVFVAAIIFGWISLAVVAGKALCSWLHFRLTPELQTLFGSLILGIVTSFLGWIPCIGWSVNLMIGTIGLGGVVLSRFGTYDENKAQNIEA